MSAESSVRSRVIGPAGSDATFRIAAESIAA
jgi:hypothetical protein